MQFREKDAKEGTVQEGNYDDIRCSVVRMEEFDVPLDNEKSKTMTDSLLGDEPELQDGYGYDDTEEDTKSNYTVKTQDPSASNNSVLTADQNANNDLRSKIIGQFYKGRNLPAFGVDSTLERSRVDANSSMQMQAKRLRSTETLKPSR